MYTLNKGASHKVFTSTILLLYKNTPSIPHTFFFWSKNLYNQRPKFFLFCSLFFQEESRRGLMSKTCDCRRQNNSTFRVVIALTLYDKKTASASVLIRFLTYDNLSQEGPEANWGREKKSTAQDVHSGITTEEWVEAFFERPKYYYYSFLWPPRLSTNTVAKTRLLLL